MPVVSPKVTPLKPIILYSLEISPNLFGETFPSKGQKIIVQPSKPGPGPCDSKSGSERIKKL